MSPRLSPSDSQLQVRGQRCRFVHFVGQISRNVPRFCVNVETRTASAQLRVANVFGQDDHSISSLRLNTEVQLCVKSLEGLEYLELGMGNVKSVAPAGMGGSKYPFRK